MNTTFNKLFFSLALSCGIFAASTLSAATESSGSNKEKKSTDPAKQHSVLKVITGPIKSAIPRVWLSEGYAKQCKVGVGESFPAVKLPNLSGAVTDLVSLRGKDATVILFWHPDRWMARTALIDMQRDIVSRVDSKKISVVGIAVHQEASSLQSILEETQIKFPQLLDTSGEALAQVGTFSLPRIYVLDSEGTIVWFDLEYSEASRRELHQTLGALIAE